MAPLELNSQKLLYHLQELSRWQSNREVWPLNALIEPVGHNGNWCLYCNGIHLKKDGVFLPQDILSRLVEDLTAKGVKAIQFCGKGEPLIHPEILRSIDFLHNHGVQSAVDTLCCPLDDKELFELLPKLNWLRLTMYAGTPGLYAKLFKSSEDQFRAIIERMGRAARMAREKRWKVSVGAHAVVSSENIETLLPLAASLKEAGLMYLQLKPLFLKDEKGQWQYLSPKETAETLKEISSLSNDQFKVSAPWNNFAPAPKRDYKHCLALPFFAEVTCRGDLYTCGPHVGDKEHFCGNLKESTFPQIWEGETKKNAFLYAATDLDVNKCMPFCRANESNRLLNQLATPPDHIAFI